MWYSALLVSIVLNNYGLYICSAQNERVMAKTVELSISCLFVCLFVLFCFVQVECGLVVSCLLFNTDRSEC